jgi:hypothetical protein
MVLLRRVQVVGILEGSGTVEDVSLGLFNDTKLI